MDEKLTVENLAEYISRISLLGKELERDLFNQDELFFRGHKKSGYPCVPGAGRSVRSNVNNSLLWFENQMIQEAKRKAPNIFADEEYPLDLLTRLQHYGIPTRLLDVTSNALVALYFACEGDSADGEVFVFKASKEVTLTRSAPIANAIAHMHQISHFTTSEFKNFIADIEDEKYFYPFSRKRHPEYKDSYDDYLQRLVDRFENPIFISAKELTERQKRQKGAFILFPNKLVKRESGWLIEDELQPLPAHYIRCRFIIPKELKKEIRGLLPHLGITKSFFFPENIDALCDEIIENTKSLYWSGL